MPSDLADFIIVGGGSAGLVLANRLSADPMVSVTVIEAGGEARSPWVQLPAGSGQLILNPKTDWRYEACEDPSIGGRQMPWANGRMLGGGSSINGQVYIRGTRHDYDRWAAMGATGWAFDDVLPYFMKAEDWQGEASPFRGVGGPVTVAPVHDPDPICDIFLKACLEAGLPAVAWSDGGVREGAFLTEASQRDGWRCSTEKAYLRPARSRQNLRVITGAQVKRIEFEAGEARRVVYRIGENERTLNANREVIACAGAIGSPALLMRSGIGPGEVLKTAGIATHCAIESVGENLQEHGLAVQTRYVSMPTFNSTFGPIGLARHALSFILGRKGPLGAPLVQAMALARSDRSLGYPDIQLHFLPFVYRLDPSRRWIKVVMPRRGGVTIGASVCHPQSRGRVRIDAAGNAFIDHRLVGHADDMATLVAGMKLVEKIFAAPAFADVVTGKRHPREIPQDDIGWSEYVRNMVGLTYHPAGTCRMGTDDGAVVDPALRVSGVGRLRVVDASVMPLLPSTNTNAPTIMIAEKAADMILSGSG